MYVVLSLYGWYAEEVIVSGPAAGKHSPVSWVKDLDCAARLSAAAADYVAKHYGGTALSLAAAWKLTEPNVEGK